MVPRTQSDDAMLASIQRNRCVATIYHGDCEDIVAREIPRRSVNLIVTSPPYADQRTSNYGGIHPDRYVDWFLPKAARFRDCLTDDGSFILNIKEKAVGGEKHPYVYDLVLALRRKLSWRLVDEYCWHKKIAIRESGPTVSEILGNDYYTSPSSHRSKCGKKQSWFPWVTGRIGGWSSSQMQTERERPLQTSQWLR